MRTAILLPLSILAIASGCNSPPGPVSGGGISQAFAQSSSAQVSINGKAVFHSAQNLPEQYPMVGTQHDLKPGQSVNLQLTLVGMGRVTTAVTGNNATCPSPQADSPFTGTLTVSAAVTESGAYGAAVGFGDLTVDFGNGCKTQFYRAQSLSQVDVAAFIDNVSDTCTNYFANKALLDCEVECAGNTQCLAQCPLSRNAGIAHGCSAVALADPLTPRQIIARPGLTAEDLESVRKVFLGEAASTSISELNLEFSELGNE